ncbi:MAG: ABC transporter permease [Acidimicrobiales bacterium]|nr:ABC transporter permease [Acidimicrobiales bacterium]
MTRLGYGVIVMFLVSVVTFVGLHVAPGDVASSVFNPTTTPPEVLEAFREQLGLGDPILVQYWNYMTGLLQGDLGYSFVRDVPVSTIIANSAWYTVALAAAAFVLAFGLGIPFGVLAALTKDRLLDRAVRFLANTFLAIPDFVLALLLVLLLGVQLGWLPVSGSESWKHLVLPAFVLAAEPWGLIVRIVRTSVLENLHADYARTLRARGVTERRIQWKHVLRNSLGPVVSLGAVQVRTLLGYALIVEVIFRWPGLGYQLVQSILNRDYAVAQALSLMLAGVVVVTSILGDLAARMVDPRIRLGEKVNA